MRVPAIAVSHVGPTRTENQDRIVVGSLLSAGTMHQPSEVSLEGDGGLLAVVDGMGGHAGGGVAAEIVATSIAVAGGHGLGPGHVRLLVNKANDELHRRMSVEHKLTAMGATLSGVTWTKTDVLVFHVGDSRVYGRFGPALHLLTVDDRTESEGGLLTRSIGGTAEHHPIEPTFSQIKLDQPARFLCCTDGLSDTLDFHEIEQHLKINPLALSAKRLLDAALARDAKDNVSFVMVDLDGDPQEPADQSGDTL